MKEGGSYEQFNNPENNPEKELKEMAQGALDFINEQKLKSNYPQKFDELIENVQSELGLTLLKVKDELDAFHKTLENVSLEQKEKIEALSQEASRVFEKVAQLMRSGLDFEVFDVMEKRLEKFSNEEGQVKKEVEDGMLEVFNVMQKTKDSMESEYREYLLKHHKSLFDQMREAAHSDKPYDSVHALASQKLFSVSDSFKQVCEENMKEAIKILNDERSQMN
jgi:hypothetical protein